MAPMSWKCKTQEGGAMPSLAAMRHEMTRLLDTFVREPFGLGAEWPFGARECTPPIDLSETPEEIIVRSEIPGIDPNELEVTVSGGQLTLAGEKKDVAAAGDRVFHQTESRFGHFRRTISLSQAVDPDQVQAEYANGVLTIRLKKVAAAAPKRVEVKTHTAEPPVV